MAKILKIKDNVNLKELEKLGFHYTNETEQFFDLNSNEDCILINNRRITLRVNEAKVYEDYNLSKLFELIQANLVEEIEEE